MRIRSKFILVFFLTSLFPLVILSYLNFNLARHALIQDTQSRLDALADLEIARIHDPSSLTSINYEYSGFDQTGEINVARRGQDSSIIYLTNRRFEQDANGPSELMIGALAGSNGFYADGIDYRGKHVVAVTKYVADLGLGVLVKIDTDEALQPVNTLRDLTLVFAFIFILIIVMVILFFVHSLTTPIISLVAIAKQVQAGSLTTRASLQREDEIGELATSFNSMVDAIQDSHEDLEKKVAERTEQLAISMKDLESFAYSVSHDLRAPLRSIDGFSKILEEDYATKFDDDGKRVISTIRTSTQHMGALIDDLLSFSRLGRQPIKTVALDMTALVKAVFTELKAAHPERNIQFTCDVLPIARVDVALMRQVWINLLSNAVKFTNKKDVAKISVSSKKKNGDTVYYVQDNGVGFDMQYVGKLFIVFQRLHSTKDFEGTGIGLSIVDRIIKKHGGKVWAEGAVNQGATFYFSLPNRDIAN